MVTTTTTTSNSTSTGNNVVVRNDPYDMRNVQFSSFCQCQESTHQVQFLVDDDTEAKKKCCTVRCYHSMNAVARSCQYKNCLKGIILFRGIPNYSNELSSDDDNCSFFHSNTTNEEREVSLRNLLLFSKELPLFYEKDDTCTMEGALMFTPYSSMLTTIRILVLFHLYRDVIETTLDMPLKLLTMDTTKDIRVAASFAFDSHNPNLGPPQYGGLVRLLHFQHPNPINRKPFLLTAKEGSINNGCHLFQKLGTTKIMIIDITTILPASVIRGQNQSRYILIHKNHVHDFHTLRLLKKRTTIEQRIQHPLAKSILSNEYKWDTSKYTALDVHIPTDVTFNSFFHTLTNETYHNTFPGFLHDQLYPTQNDVMYNIIAQTAISVKTNLLNKSTITTNNNINNNNNIQQSNEKAETKPKKKKRNKNKKSSTNVEE